jgi:hypothetical protein
MTYDRFVLRPNLNNFYTVPVRVNLRPFAHAAQVKPGSTSAQVSSCLGFMTLSTRKYLPHTTFSRVFHWFPTARPSGVSYLHMAESPPLSPGPPDFSDASLPTLRHLVEHELKNYKPDGEKDNTAVILKAFAEQLPDDGARNICLDILKRDSDAEVRQMGKHLFEAVLVPSESSSSTLYVVYFNSDYVCL